MAIEVEIKKISPLNVEIQPISAGGNTPTEVYNGSYTVIPLTTRQTLQTRQKLMRENLVVEKIPYAEVSNIANGTTVTIA